MLPKWKQEKYILVLLFWVLSLYDVNEREVWSMALHDNIKKLREEKNLTQQQLADKLYVSRQTVCRWENGSRCPDLITAKKLALELDVSMDELISDEDVNDILDLVPDEIIKQIMKNYGCSKKQLKEAVKAELRNESEDYPHCDSVTSYGSTKQTRQYSEYIDRRVEDCMDEDKISKMELCVVNVEDDYYYYDQPAYQYGRDKHTWYSMNATNFVAYAVWEKY